MRRVNSESPLDGINDGVMARDCTSKASASRFAATTAAARAVTRQSVLAIMVVAALQWRAASSREAASAGQRQRGILPPSSLGLPRAPTKLGELRACHAARRGT